VNWDDVSAAAQAAVQRFRWLEQHLDDLKQDLAERALKKHAADPALLRKMAVDLLLEIARRERREFEKREHVAVRAPVWNHRTGSDWHPTWYKPHAHAQEYAPFACSGARVMHVSASKHATSKG
jgi:hypothetical protein